jgi:hypothetical protein
MTTNITNPSTIAYLNFITGEFNRYIPLPFLFFGTIGNILNILVFTRPLLRTNPCSLYFVSGSIINFLSLYDGLITPFLGSYGLDPTQKINILCKIRYYLRYASITLSTWFILFACLDRFLSSSTNANTRSWSSLHLAKRIILLASIIGFIFPYTQVFYCYSINKNNTCTYTNNICKLSIDSILLLCNSGVPPIVMVLLSILTIQNIKYLNRTNAVRRRDVQLNRILLVQVIVLVLFATPITAQKIYSFATMFKTKSDLTTAIDNLTHQISTEISYINNSITFYIYSLTSKRFRKEVSQIFSSLFACQYHPRAPNTVQPITVRFRQNPNEAIIKIDHQRTRLGVAIDNQ